MRGDRISCMKNEREMAFARSIILSPDVDIVCWVLFLCAEYGGSEHPIDERISRGHQRL